MNQCRHCKQYSTAAVVDVRQVYKDKQYVYYTCRSCATERAKRYRATTKGKVSIKKSVQKYKLANKTRYEAWHKCSGLPSMACEVCSTTENIHKHHPDITEPMMVRYLCALHHKAVHMNKIVL